MQTSVFTDDRYSFSGNQLATFWNLSEDDVSKEEMQGITREMNFSETTFVFPSTVENCIRKVRIFTPGREIPFAGHPTLGTAFVLKNKGVIDPNVTESYLELGIGPTKVKFQNDNQIQMYQQTPQFLEEFQDKKAITEVLGVSPQLVSDKWPIQFVSTGFPFLIIPLISLKAIRAIQLNVNALLETLKDYPSQEIVVFSPETIHPNSNAHVRMFAPSAGVFEDPATGSAAGPTGAYLEENQVLTNHTLRSEIVLEQGYEIHRPSRLVVRCLYKNDTISRVVVGGQVKLIAQGKFFL
ncbi:MAG: PhzF family phenazine biosynthesis protein [Candidatus Hermodarchaeota archaeon]